MCIPHTGSLTKRLLPSAASGPLRAPFREPRCLPPVNPPLNRRPNSLTIQETTNTQKTNLINPAKKPMVLLAPAPSASSLATEHIGATLMRRGEPSVCKQKSMRQTKLCDFNRLRGGTIYRRGTRRARRDTISLLLSYIYCKPATDQGNGPSPRSIHLGEFGRLPCTDAGLREG